MNNEKKHASAPRRGHGPGAGAGEKPKNLSETIKKMTKYLNKLLPFIIIALVFAALSSICSIIGPNKLSDLTDELSKGLVINKEELSKVTDDISSTLNEENIKNISTQIMDVKLDRETIYMINSSSTILDSDKLAFNNFLSKVSNLSKDKIASEIVSLPTSIITVILPDSKINNELVTSSDKITFINIFKDVDGSSQKEMLKKINELPKSIQNLLLPDSKINKTLVKTDEKVAFLNKMGNISENSSAKTIYKAVDELPNSIADLIRPKLNFDVIKKIVIFLLILYLSSALFNLLQSLLMAIMSNKFAQELRSKISVKINKLSLKYFDTHSKGDILSRVTNDVDTVGVNLSQSLGSLVSAITLFIGCIIMMFVTNWIMAITAILSSLFGFAFMMVVLSKSQKYFLARQVELGKLNGHIEEIYSNHNVVKAYNGNYDASKTFDELNDNVFECNRMSQFLSGLMPSMMNFIGNFGYVAVCIVGASLVVNNQISFGVIVAFMIYVRLFTSPLSQIAQGMTSIQSTAAAAERVFEFIEEEEMEDESHLKRKLNPKKVKGNIEFKHVKFGYDENKIIVKDFNCKVKPGQKVAIVGPTGAGKTTMVNLLMKFYNIKDGDILIDGVSTKELTRENIHDLFIMVLQDTWLFDGTIRDNVKYNKNKVSDEQIMEALKIVGVDHFVKSLPGTLDYVIKDNESISAGQKQLLTIARGMIKNAPFLILDEATSSVDTRTEELVQKAMDKLTKGRTSFIIAHRLSTIKNADIILVMNEGNIIEQGTHKELMNKNGFYAELYNSQFKN